MTPETLDRLLDGSAPATRAPRDADLAAMIPAAQTEARPTGARRWRRATVTAGVLAAVLLGGAGVAAATDGLGWAPWVRNPFVAIPFAAGDGVDCEVRFAEYVQGSDPSLVADAAFLAQVNRALEGWYRETDVASEARARLPQKRAEVEAMQEGAEIDLSELSAAEQREAARRAWIQEWKLWTMVVDDLETEALREAGISLPDERFVGVERLGQVQCSDGSGEYYAPGVGR
jgi:hypothetical protein